MWNILGIWVGVRWLRRLFALDLAQLAKRVGVDGAKKGIFG
jgi:hypothetical protein